MGVAVNPITHPVLDIFLLGFVASCSLCAALFFLRFWRKTRDSLFLAFAAFFAIQGLLSASAASLQRPNEGTLWFFILRLLSILLVLGAIVRKNVVRR
jgi:uncharacterized membrane protein HdeD (DUF308 family)